MLTEIDVTKYAIKLNGMIIKSNLPSRAIAEAELFKLPDHQRMVAEIVVMTQDNKTILFG